MAKNSNLQDDEKLVQEVQKYKCLYDKSVSAYKERDCEANAWVAVKMALNLSDGNDDYSLFLFKYLLHFFHLLCVFIIFKHLCPVSAELSQYIFREEARTPTNI